MSDAFESRFGRPAEVMARAPGRVYLIGEHADANGGFALPMPVPLHTTVELARRDDERVFAASAQLPAADGTIASYAITHERKTSTWLDHVEGVTWALHEDGFVTGGFDVFIASTVPIGAGLSSSASLDVALLRALRKACQLVIDDVEVGLLAQRVEADFIGAPVGVMDSMASSLGVEDRALFLDTRTLAHRRLALPPGAELVIVDSGQRRSTALGDHRLRRAECEEAAALLGVPQLRDVDPSDLGQLDGLREPLARRARHVITENRRVKDAVRALDRGDPALLGDLLLESHASLRDDFEVSTPAIDALVSHAMARDDVYGARLTGGGFGGAIVALVREGRAREVGESVARTRRGASVIVPVPSPAVSPFEVPR